MTHVTAREDGDGLTPNERLAAELAKQRYSLRGFAKRLAGPDAGHSAIETRRRQLGAWVNEGRAMSDESAEMLARELGTPQDYFKSPKQPRRRTADELSEISRKLDEVLERVAQTSASYEARLAKLEEQVDQILDLNETSFEVLLAAVARIEKVEAARSARPAPRRKRAN